MTIEMRPGRASLYVVLTVLLLGAALRALPSAIDAAKLLALRENPASFADANLDRLLTPQRFSEGFDAALTSRDGDLAQSFIELGRGRGLAPSAEQAVRFDTLRAEEKGKTVEAFTEGFLHGQRDSSAAFTGALASDLVGYGDLRDLWNEAEKLRRGERADTLIVGLAAAGLALSVVTWSSIGAILPARSGLTLVKDAQRAGRLSAPLALLLSNAAAKAVDREALAAGAAAAAKLDFAVARAAAKSVLRPGALSAFRALGADAATIYRRAGAGGVKDALALAGGSTELRQVARLAAARGGATRAILATLGRSALVLAGLTTAAVEAAFTVLAAFVGLAILAQRFGF